MRPKRWPFGLPLSVLVHAASLLLIVGLASRTSELAPLFVDLTLDQAPVRRRDAPMEERRRGPVRAAASAPGRPEAPGPAVASPRDSGRDGAVRGDAGDDPAPSGARAMPSEPARPSATEALSLPDPLAYALPRAVPLPSPVTAAPLAAAAGPSPPAPAEVSQHALDPVPERAQPAASQEAAATSTSRLRTESEASGLRGTTGGAGRLPPTAAYSGARGEGERGGEGVGAGGGAKGEGGAGGTGLPSSQGAGGGGTGYGPYLRLWRTRIHEGLSYPLAARRRSLTGTVHIEIAIEANGALSEVRVVESSSHSLLDDAAVQSVRNLPPIPFPPELTPRPLRARLPVVFDLR